MTPFNRSSDLVLLRQSSGPVRGVIAQRSLRANEPGQLPTIQEFRISSRNGIELLREFEATEVTPPPADGTTVLIERERLERSNELGLRDRSAFQLAQECEWRGARAIFANGYERLGLLDARQVKLGDAAVRLIVGIDPYDERRDRVGIRSVNVSTSSVYDDQYEYVKPEELLVRSMAGRYVRARIGLSERRLLIDALPFLLADRDDAAQGQLAVHAEMKLPVEQRWLRFPNRLQRLNDIAAQRAVVTALASGFDKVLLESSGDAGQVADLFTFESPVDSEWRIDYDTFRPHDGFVDRKRVPSADLAVAVDLIRHSEVVAVAPSDIPYWSAATEERLDLALSQRESRRLEMAEARRVRRLARGPALAPKKNEVVSPSLKRQPSLLVVPTTWSDLMVKGPVRRTSGSTLFRSPGSTARRSLSTEVRRVEQGDVHDVVDRVLTYMAIITERYWGAQGKRLSVQLEMHEGYRVAIEGDPPADVLPFRRGEDDAVENWLQASGLSYEAPRNLIEFSRLRPRLPQVDRRREATLLDALQREGVPAPVGALLRSSAFRARSIDAARKRLLAYLDEPIDSEGRPAYWIPDPSHLRHEMDWILRKGIAPNDAQSGTIGKGRVFHSRYGQPSLITAMQGVQRSEEQQRGIAGLVVSEPLQGYVVALADATVRLMRDLNSHRASDVAKNLARIVGAGGAEVEDCLPLDALGEWDRRVRELGLDHNLQLPKRMTEILDDGHALGVPKLEPRFHGKTIRRGKGEGEYPAQLDFGAS